MTHIRRLAGLLALIASGSLLVVGCSTTAPTTEPGVLPDDFPDHSAEEIETFIRRSSDTLHSFAATARVTIRSPDENRSFDAAVRQQRADSLFMRFSLFGVEGGRLLVTSDSVFFYDSRKQTLQVGPVTAAQEILPAPVTSDQMFENMVGLMAPDPSTSWSVTADSSLYYLTDPSNQQYITVDPSRWRVVRYAKESAEGSVVEERTFSDFKQVQGLLVPHRVIFRRPSEGLMAMIQYQEIELNPEELSFGLDLPEQVHREDLR